MTANDNGFSRLLDQTGDGTGTNDISLNFTETTAYKLAPASNETFVVHYLQFFMKDSVGIDADTIGKDIDYTNGFHVQTATAAGVQRTFTDANHPITSNARLASYSSAAQLLDWGNGDDVVICRWDFVESHGRPVVCDGDQGEWLECEFGIGDLSGLNQGYIIAQGYKMMTNTPGPWEFPQRASWTARQR